MKNITEKINDLYEDLLKDTCDPEILIDIASRLKIETIEDNLAVERFIRNCRDTILSREDND